MICAYGKAKGMCDGDSGSPLSTYDHTYNYWTQIGVGSWRQKPCGIAKGPGVYARVAAQLDWIKAYITGQTCPPPSS